MSAKSFLTGKPFDLPWISESNLIEGVDDEQEDDRSLQTWHELQDRHWSLATILWMHQGIMDCLRPDIAGKLRARPVWIGGREGVHYAVVPEHLERFVSVYRDVKDESRIQQSHVVFEKIHPFEDGNGRTGRMLMNWQRVRAGLDPLCILASERDEYYKWFG